MCASAPWRSSAASSSVLRMLERPGSRTVLGSSQSHAYTVFSSARSCPMSTEPQTSLLTQQTESLASADRLSIGCRPRKQHRVAREWGLHDAHTNSPRADNRGAAHSMVPTGRCCPSSPGKKQRKACVQCSVPSAATGLSTKAWLAGYVYMRAPGQRLQLGHGAAAQRKASVPGAQRRRVVLAVGAAVQFVSIRARDRGCGRRRAARAPAPLEQRGARQPAGPEADGVPIQEQPAARGRSGGRVGAAGRTGCTLWHGLLVPTPERRVRSASLGAGLGASAVQGRAAGRLCRRQPGHGCSWQAQNGVQPCRGPRLIGILPALQPDVLQRERRAGDRSQVARSPRGRVAAASQQLHQRQPGLRAWRVSGHSLAAAAEPHHNAGGRAHFGVERVPGGSAPACS